MVFQEADLPVRVVRDIFSEQFERAIVDDEKQHHRLESFFTRTAPELVDAVELYKDEKRRCSSATASRRRSSPRCSRRVDLPSGGYLIIDYAEAMTVIDINSGSFTGRGKGARLEDTITKTNLEAAEEVVRQLRLRDIGGIIVIDFIDMSRARNRDAVLKTLRKALDEDRTKTYVVEISPLGLVEMTRQNVTEGVREILTKPCPTCDGEGVVLSEETVAIEVERKLRELAAERPQPEAFLIQVHPRVAALLVGGPGRPLLEIEEETGKHFHFEGSEALPIDHFAVALEGRREEIEERALPFREGEEVLVTIEEPHMYNEDDAVAKLDGYVISVAGAGRLIGKKTLVRIEKVGRSAASATSAAPRRRAREAARRRAARPGRAAAGAAERRAAAAGEARARRPAGGRKNASEHATDCGLAANDRPASALPPGRRLSVMYAIVKVGGKQYRVEKGDTLLVDRMPEDEGAKVTLEPLLFRGDGKDDAVFGGDDLGKVKVEAMVAGHERGKKIHVLKFKPKRGYKRRSGPPLGADPARDRRHQAGGPQACVPAKPKAEAEAGGEASRSRRRPSRSPPAKKPAAKKPAAKKPAGEEAGSEEAGRQEGGLRWLIRRDSAPAATAATPTPSAWA